MCSGERLRLSARPALSGRRQWFTLRHAQVVSLVLVLDGTITDEHVDAARAEPEPECLVHWGDEHIGDIVGVATKTATAFASPFC